MARSKRQDRRTPALLTPAKPHCGATKAVLGRGRPSAFYCHVIGEGTPTYAPFSGVWRLSLFVGYAQNRLQNGATMVAPQFLNVGVSEAMPLEALTPTGSDTEGVEIQTLTALGYTDKFYTWNTWMYSEPCWVDGDLNPVDGVVFESGSGLWVQGSSAEQGFQSAGKVGTTDVNVQLRNGATATGNPFPVALDLNDILPNGGEDTTVDLEGVEIQTLTALGYTDKFYTWNTWMYGEPCWVDGDLNPIEGVSFDPGQGLWVQGSSSAQYIRFPAPELNN